MTTEIVSNYYCDMCHRKYLVLLLNVMSGNKTGLTSFDPTSSLIQVGFDPRYLTFHHLQTAGIVYSEGGRSVPPMSSIQ